MISFKNLIVILIIMLVLFGPKRISELAKGLGKGIKDFKKAMKDEDLDEVKADITNTLKLEEADDR